MKTNTDPFEKFTANIPVTVDSNTLWDIMTTMRESAYEWFDFSDVVRRPEDGIFTSFTAQEIDAALSHIRSGGAEDYQRNDEGE